MIITGRDVQDMVAHWLSTPVNKYLGSDYGCDAKSLLQNPQSIGIANSFIAKLKKDVPILSMLPANSVNLYSKKDGIDKLNIFIDIAGTALQVTGIN